MTTINVTKVFNLNENVIFPSCHVCGKELTPFCITKQEINDKLNSDKIDSLLNMKLLLLDEIKKDKHLLYLCKHCLHGEINASND